LTAVVTASFSWGNVDTSHWVGPAFWYASLSTSICGIFLATQQLALLALIGDIPEEPDDPKTTTVLRRHLSQILAEKQPTVISPSQGVEAAHGSFQYGRGDASWEISWRLIFSWQCPMMFIGYSTLFYMIGLSTVVCTPLFQEEWGPNCYVSCVGRGICIGLRNRR